VQRGVFVFAAGESAHEPETVNSSRLAELERQRALVREQLAWLEREIARERADAPVLSDGSASRAQSASELAAYTAPQSAGLKSATDEYQPNPKDAAESARRGCLMAVLTTFVFLVAAFVALYFYRYSDRPLLFPSHAEAPAKH
jgi:hypothetical protein